MKRLLLIIYSIGIFTVNAQNSGDLDITFGNNGFSWAGAGPLDDYLSDLLVDSNGGIIGLGTVYEGGSTHDFALVKVTSDGVDWDSNFANNGINTSTQISTSPYSGIIGVLQQDGKILASGSQGGGFAVVRYNFDGSLDDTFSGDGKLFINVLSNGISNFETPINMKLFNDSSIMVIGRLNDGWGNNFTYLSKINSDGTIDNSFGTDGSITFSSYVAQKALFYDDNDFVAAITEDSFLKIKKYSTDGQLDTSFGVSGETSIEIEQNITLGDLVLDNQNNIYLTGYWSNDDDNIDYSQSWLLKLNSNGEIDNTFGINGIQLLSVVNYSDSRSEFPKSIILDNGLLYVGGYYNTTYSSTSFKGYVACFDLNGNLNNSFGTNGIISLGNTLNKVKKIKIDNDGKILIAGDDTYSDDDFMFARIHTSNSLSVEDINIDTTIKLFPNPVNDLLKIQTKKSLINQIKIYNNLGQIITDIVNVNKYSYYVNTASLQQGIYHIKIIDEKGNTFNSKILKN
ncbi:T9SS type A sorting domain-containing protein [Kordia sp. TARA_039_SRF]|nr:T9SS type A sorting domain-containing protein [Kordia sp. TARA_039_SRF]